MKKNLFNLLLTGLLTLPDITLAQSLQSIKPLNSSTDEKDHTYASQHFSHFSLFEQQPATTVAFLNDIQYSYNSNSKYKIALPTINGEIMQFEIYNSGILSNYYQEQYNHIKTFKGQSEDKAYTVRLTLSPLGMMGKIKRKADGKSWYFQPLQNNQPEILIVYASNDEKLRAGKTISCNAEDLMEHEYLGNNLLKSNNDATVQASFGDCQLRTYRLAVATTGEYTTWAGGQAAALATLTNSVNIISEMYERDLTIKFSLVTNNNIIFPNETTDPYSAGLSSTVLTQNNTTLNNPTYLGSSLYDVGVLFGYGTGWSGGLAQLSSVCTGSKGRSAGGLNSSWPTGSSGPVFDGTMAHEIGHQFSATHTMSANTGGCGPNLNTGSMWEAGGGSTIMAYAGTCNPLHYQWNSDDYFHAGNINQMITFLNSPTNTCAQTSNSNNFSPITSTNASTFTIPHSTPFKLQINASDNNDNLTYTFDQLNNAPSGGVNTAPQSTSTVGPLFRSRYPSTENFRHYPSLAIQNGQESGTFEVLPSVARTINIRGVVRDNNDEAGCVAYEDFTINVQNCGPFVFTNLLNDTSVVADGSNTLTLNWNTASSCVTTPNVAIKFSKDGGKAFPYIVLASTPNDGTETIVIPNLSTCNGRFIIEALGNIYYTINTGIINIESACIVNGASISPDSMVTAEVNSPLLNLAHIQALISDSTLTTLSGTLTTAVAPSMLSLKNLATNSCVSFGNQAYYEIFEVYPTASASYTFTKSATSSSVINIYEGTFNPSNPCVGFLNSSTTIANASSGANIGNSVTESLCANQKYTIVVTSFSDTLPTLPHIFNINVTSNISGAELKYNGPGLPSGTSYGYVIVNNTNNQIVAIVDTVNMTNGAIYSTGNYTIYGVSTTSSLITLHTTYANTSFSTFATAALNQTSNLCAELSSNVVPVAIIEPLATELITFTGNVTEKQTALLTWKVAEDDDIKYYELERSATANNYEPIATIASKYDVDGNNINTYRFEDIEFNKAAQPLAQYRLKLITASNKVSYSSVVSLQLAKQDEIITIAPNPIESGEVIVSFNNSQKGKYEIAIYNLLGNIIKQASYNKDATTKTLHIDVNELPSGIYILQVSNGTKNEVIKFVKP